MESEPVFVPALNQPPTTFSLFFPSLLSSTTTATRASPLPRLPAIVLRCSFSSRFEPTSSPNHANVLSLRLQRHLSYNYNPCPLHSAGSSHTTYVPRASELVATAGRSLDYVPSLFHHHPTTTLAHTLSFSQPSWPFPYPSTRPLRHFHHHRLGSPTLCPLSLVLVAPTISVFLADNFDPLLHIVISLATSLSNYRQTVSFHYTDVVSSVERNLPLALTHAVTRQLSSLRRASFGRFF